MASDELPAHVIERAQRGEAAAFRRVVERYQAGVFKLAYNMTSDYTEAADLAQEVFLRVYRFFDKFDLRRPLTPWIYRVATNVVLNHLNARRLPILGIDERDEARPPQPAGAEAILERREESEIVCAAVAQLKPNLRAAVTLFYLKELSLRDVAHALDVPQGTAKVWLFRGRQALKEKLEKPQP